MNTQTKECCSKCKSENECMLYGQCECHFSGTLDKLRANNLDLNPNEPRYSQNQLNEILKKKNEEIKQLTPTQDETIEELIKGASKFFDGYINCDLDGLVRYFVASSDRKVAEERIKVRDEFVIEVYKTLKEMQKNLPFESNEKLGAISAISHIQNKLDEISLTPPSKPLAKYETGGALLTYKPDKSLDWKE